MTRNQFRKKVRELIRTQNVMIIKKMESVLKSDWLNLSEIDTDDYSVAKYFMCAVDNEMSFQWSPLTDKGRKEVANIKHFI